MSREKGQEGVEEEAQALMLQASEPVTPGPASGHTNDLQRPVLDTVGDTSDAPDKRTRFLSMRERKEATELLMQGHSVSSIAKVLERSIPTISRVKKEVLNGKSWNEKRSKKRKSKFDNPDTIQMITNHWNDSDGNLTYEKIAELLGVSLSIRQLLPKQIIYS